MFLLLAAALICGASLLTSCKKIPTAGIAMIAKNGQSDYWRQVESAFQNACKEKGLDAYYYATTAGNAYEEQIAAVESIRMLDSKKLKGIIFAPIYGMDGESAEAEVAALARERGIPVIIIESPVKPNSPLAERPYFGTDNTAAGKALANKVPVDRMVAFTRTDNPSIERAEAFQTLKPNAVIYPVNDQVVNVVQALLNDYDDFVFFNGKDLMDVLRILKAAGKNVYTFDVYGEFLDELIAGNAYFKGIMAQNNFLMTRKAVDAVLDNATQGDMVPTFYITKDNLDDPNVLPFMEFYGKRK